MHVNLTVASEKFNRKTKINPIKTLFKLLMKFKYFGLENLLTTL